MIQETISHYLDEVLEQDDAFSDVGRIAGPDQAPGILELRSRTHLTWASYLRNLRHQLPISTFDIEPRCTIANLFIEHSGLEFGLSPSPPAALCDTSAQTS